MHGIYILDQWIYILGVVITLYVVGSLRVLKQYERGVVFLLGRFDGAPRTRSHAHLPSHPTDDARVPADGHDANPVAKNHHEG